MQLKVSAYKYKSIAGSSHKGLLQNTSQINNKKYYLQIVHCTVAHFTVAIKPKNHIDCKKSQYCYIVTALADVCTVLKILHDRIHTHQIHTF